MINEKNTKAKAHIIPELEADKKIKDEVENTKALEYAKVVV